MTGCSRGLSVSDIPGSKFQPFFLSCKDGSDVHISGISFGMQNLLRTSTGGVAFAQPPATSLNPYKMKPDDIKAVQKILIG
jgi:hypothetical protein